MLWYDGIYGMVVLRSMQPKECSEKSIVHYKAIVEIMGVQPIEVQPKRVR